MNQNGDIVTPGAPVATGPDELRRFTFVRHGDHATQSLDWDKGPEQVRKALSEVMGVRNVAFLLGAGCSSLRIDGTERGIATMMPLAGEFCSPTTEENAAPWRFEEDDDL